MRHLEPKRRRRDKARKARGLEPSGFVSLVLAMALGCCGLSELALGAEPLLKWSFLADLPDQEGFGGSFAGVHQDALLVAGGANFPGAPPWKGGQKVWYDDIWLLESTAGNWRKVGRLPHPLAYGAAVSTEDGLLLIGGDDGGRPVAEVLQLRWQPDTRTVAINSLPPLSHPLTYCAAGLIDSTVYVVGSIRSEGSERLDTKVFAALDLNRLGDGGDWQLLAPWPGAPRHKAIMAVQRDESAQQCLYLFSGENPRWENGEQVLSPDNYLTDAWFYHPGRSEWSALPDLPPVAESRAVPGHQEWLPHPVAAGTGIGVGDDTILLFSGSTGRFVAEEQASAPLFPRDILAFNSRTKEWNTAGSMPIGVVTTSITRWGERLVIPSGEIRPGTRTSKVQVAERRLPPPDTTDSIGPPNILFIYTDDLAPTAVGFAGHPQLLTPHIDRIAREGVTLANSFVTTPVCSPSRAGLATSRYSSELGILDWINPREEPEHGLDPSLLTWMEVLQQAGYATGLAGKWHLGTADRFHPTRTGYDWFAGFRDGGRPPKDALLEIDGEDVQTAGFIVDVVTDQALGFLERHQDGPFLLSVHYREPHARWLPTREEDWRPYWHILPRLPVPDFPDLDVARVQRMSREYFASVASVDRNVGRLLDALDRRGLTDNTVVIFTSDHGYHTGHHGLWFKGNAQWQTLTLPEQRWSHIPPAQRPNLLDQALRVPTAVRWPGKIPAGLVMTRTFTNLDWYPTLLAMAGVDLPEGVTLRGRNALPLLLGTDREWDDTLYSEYSMRHGATTDMRSLRTREWKLMIDFANEGRGELYDLTRDPGETANLFDSSESQITELREQLTEQLLARSRALASSPIPRAR